MEEIEQRILEYHQLPPDEREAVEAYVDTHPEWATLLNDVKTLSALAGRARLFESPHSSDDALAHFVVARHVHRGDLSPAMQDVFASLETRLRTDADLKARYDAMRARLQRVAGTMDPVAHFEELTGRSLGGSAGSEPERVAEGREPKPLASDRPPRPSETSLARRIKQGSQWLGLAAVALAALYGTLFLASEWSQGPVEELSLIAMSETELEGYSIRTRSAPADAEAASTDAIYRRALHRLQEAQTSTLGLFPRFEASGLRSAEGLLQQVVEQEETNSFLQLEAYFFLGKVHLAQGELDAARVDFKRVVAGEGRRAAEASTILTRLQEVAPTQRGAEPMFDADDALPTS